MDSFGSHMLAATFLRKTMIKPESWGSFLISISMLRRYRCNRRIPSSTMEMFSTVNDIVDEIVTCGRVFTLAFLLLPVRHHCWLAR